MSGVVGDVFWRLVARSLAQQFAKKVESATAPFQYALSTRVGCECVSHALQSLTDLDESATILSVDGVGAFGLVSRKAMFQGLLNMVGGDSLLPFARQFMDLHRPTSALVAVSELLQVGGLLFAIHDDLYIKCSPDRAVECSRILRQELWQHCRILLNNGKIRCGTEQVLFPRDCEVLEDAARLVDPDVVVW